MIRLEVVGNLGNDAVCRAHNDQVAISFSVAHTSKYTDNSGVLQDKTIWVNCTLWRKQGKDAVAQYLKKGSKVFVSGEPLARLYAKPDGSSAVSLDMRVFDVELCGSNAGAATHSDSEKQEAGAKTQAGLTPAENPDDLPF